MLKRISKAIKRIPLSIRFLGYGMFTLLLMRYTKLPLSIYFEFMLVIQIAIYMYASLMPEIPITEVTLFVDGTYIDRMKRIIAPSRGDTIVIDCGDLVKVIDVNYQWDTPNAIQINCISVKEDEKDD